MGFVKKPKNKNKDDDLSGIYGIKFIQEDGRKLREKYEKLISQIKC